MIIWVINGVVDVFLMDCVDVVCVLVCNGGFDKNVVIMIEMYLICLVRVK